MHFLASKFPWILWKSQLFLLVFHLPGDFRELRPLWGSGGGPGGRSFWIWPEQQGWRLLLLQQPGLEPGLRLWSCEVDPILDDVFCLICLICLDSSNQLNRRFSLWCEVCIFYSSLDCSDGRVVFFRIVVLDFAYFLVWLESWICWLDES